MFLLEWLIWRFRNHDAASTTQRPRAKMDVRRAMTIGSMIGRWTRYHDQR